jgi:integrase
LKSDAARRKIEIPPQLANLLRAHRKEMLRKSLHRAEGFVFCTETGAPNYYRNLSSRGLDEAANRTGLNPPGKQRLSMHDLRHTAITHLIRAGADVGQGPPHTPRLPRPAWRPHRPTELAQARVEAGTRSGRAGE